MAREMKDSGIEWVGAKPATWQVALASQVFSQVKCKNTGLVEQNLLSLSYGKIKRKSIDATAGLLPESFDGYNIIERDDIVLRLTDLQNDHKSLRVGRTTERGIITSAYLSIRPSKNHDSQFLYYYLHSFDICKGLYGMGSGVRQGLNWDDIKRLQILVPPQSEQKQIASFLDRKCAEIDSVIADTQRTIEEYKVLKQSIITEAVTKGVRGERPMKDSGIEWIGEIPVEWEVTKFKKLGYCRNGLTYSPENQCGEEGTLVLRSSNIQNGMLDFSDCVYVNCSVRDDLMVRPNDILICSRNGSAKLIGKNAIIPDGLKASFGAFMMIYRCQSPKYMQYILSSHIFSYYLGTFLTVSVNQLTGKNFDNIQFPYTDDYLEQEEIITYLDKKCSEIDQLIESKQQLLTELESYKKSVIYEYVTGKKEVHACQ